MTKRSVGGDTPGEDAAPIGRVTANLAALPPLDDDPSVAVMMAVMNESGHIEAAIQSILNQDWPRIDQIAIAIAPSHDNTREVVERVAQEDSRVILIDNPEGTVSFGLNRAIAATSCPVVVRVDGHCELPRGYVSASIRALTSTRASVVGGVQRAVGVEPFQTAVAAAMTSRLGVGNATFHFGGAAGPTDTVFLGVFRREALTAVGGYDPDLLRNQDYDLNFRIRALNGTVWFTPELEVEYRPRASVLSLGRQYFQYGWWKRIMLRKNPKAIRPRQLAPPLLVLGLTVSVISAVLTRNLRFLAPFAAYPVAISFAAIATSRDLHIATRIRLPLALMTMHLSWGAGFIASRRTS